MTYSIIHVTPEPAERFLALLHECGLTELRVVEYTVYALIPGSEDDVVEADYSQPLRQEWSIKPIRKDWESDWRGGIIASCHYTAACTIAAMVTRHFPAWGVFENPKRDADRETLARDVAASLLPIDESVFSEADEVKAITRYEATTARGREIAGRRQRAIEAARAVLDAARVMGSLKNKFTGILMRDDLYRDEATRPVAQLITDGLLTFNEVVAAIRS